jgi:hypothetical protein
MTKKDLIEKTKEFVAKGYGDGLGCSHWFWAMQFTHRKKTQIILYERVIDLLAEAVLSRN